MTNRDRDDQGGIAWAEHVILLGGAVRLMTPPWKGACYALLNDQLVEYGEEDSPVALRETLKEYFYKYEDSEIRFSKAELRPESVRTPPDATEAALSDYIDPETGEVQP
jgi:hypothetical protein